MRLKGLSFVRIQATKAALRPETAQGDYTNPVSIELELKNPPPPKPTITDMNLVSGALFGKTENIINPIIQMHNPII